MDKTPSAVSLAYLTTDFPVLSHTFISREVVGLEKRGVDIQHLSIHTPDPAEISSEDLHFKDRVFYIFPLNKLDFIKTHIQFFLRMPGKYTYWLYYVISRKETRFRDRIRSLYHFAEAVYLAKEVERRHIKHIHAHFFQGNATVAMVISKLLGTTYSITAHGTALLVDRILNKEKIEHAKFIISISQYNKNFMLKIDPSCDDKVFVVHCGLNLQKFLPPTQAPHNEVFTLLSVGRLVWEKAYHYLIETCRILRDEGVKFRCLLVGDGELREELESLIEKYDLGSHIELLGSVFQEKIQDYYQQADAFILTSVSEGLPVVLMEAMAKELPVIASDITGIPELLDDGVNGYLIPAKQPQAYADAVKKMIENPQQRVAMGQKGREKVLAEFDIEKNTQQLHDIYHSQLKENPVD